MEVIVPDDQLSLAIGRKGQNVRLASRLTGWRLDVRSEAEAEAEAHRSRELLTAIAGIDDGTAEALYQAGIKGAIDVVAADQLTISDLTGASGEALSRLLASAGECAEVERREAERAAAERAAAAARAAERGEGDPERAGAPMEGSGE
jgi:N utilization substance protein A